MFGTAFQPDAFQNDAFQIFIDTHDGGIGAADYTHRKKLAKKRQALLEASEKEKLEYAQSLRKEIEALFNKDKIQPEEIEDYQIEAEAIQSSMPTAYESSAVVSLQLQEFLTQLAEIRNLLIDAELLQKKQQLLFEEEAFLLLALLS